VTAPVGLTTTLRHAIHPRSPMATPRPKPWKREGTFPPGLETFQSRSRLDLLRNGERRAASGCWQNAAADPGRLHRPDCKARGR